MADGMCDLCGERPATIRFTEIRDDTKTELNLCDGCARTKGLGPGAPSAKVEIGIGDLLAGMFEEASESASLTGLECPQCGLTYAEFKQVGRFGCAACYEAFAPVLGALLEKIHGKSRHEGKAPARTSGLLGMRTVLREKQAALRSAVEREDFESAARLRDECRDLEEELRLQGPQHTN